jgi:hypothetical protein
MSIVMLASPKLLSLPIFTFDLAMDIQTKLRKGGTQNATFIGLCKKVFKDLISTNLDFFKT